MEFLLDFLEGFLVAKNVVFVNEYKSGFFHVFGHVVFLDSFLGVFGLGFLVGEVFGEIHSGLFEAVGSECF